MEHDPRYDLISLVRKLSEGKPGNTTALIMSLVEMWSLKALKEHPMHAAFGKTAEDAERVYLAAIWDLVRPMLPTTTFSVSEATATTMLAAYFTFEGNWDRAIQATRKALEENGVDYASLIEQLRPVHEAHVQNAARRTMEEVRND